MGPDDPYALLGVADDADGETIRKAYRALAFSCHPDIHPDDPLAAERFVALGEAFALLADPGRRAAYDRLRRFSRLLPGNIRPPSRPAGGSQTFFIPAPAPTPRRGADITWTFDIPATVAGKGGRIAFPGASPAPCVRCGGSGKRLGTCWVCNGRGSIRQPAGPVQLTRVCPACDGQGLEYTPCPACRGRGWLPGPRPAVVAVAPGTVTGDRLVARGAGEPGSGGAENGDLFLVVRVLDPHQGLCNPDGGEG